MRRHLVIPAPGTKLIELGLMVFGLILLGLMGLGCQATPTSDPFLGPCQIPPAATRTPGDYYPNGPALRPTAPNVLPSQPPAIQLPDLSPSGGAPALQSSVSSDRSLLRRVAAVLSPNSNRAERIAETIQPRAKFRTSGSGSGGASYTEKNRTSPAIFRRVVKIGSDDSGKPEIRVVDSGPTEANDASTNKLNETTDAPIQEEFVENITVEIKSADQAGWREAAPELRESKTSGPSDMTGPTTSRPLHMASSKGGSTDRAADRYGHAADYAWLKGKLEYSATRRQWKLRYVPIDGPTDAHGGSVLLSGPEAEEALVNLSSGEFVEARGRVGDRDPKKSGFAPVYSVLSLRAI